MIRMWGIQNFNDQSQIDLFDMIFMIERVCINFYFYINFYKLTRFYII